jgi:[acyl-carrier-protein] S-malonyltransferase
MTDQGHILLCPGQGAQHVGMGAKWAAASHVAAEIFRKADQVLDAPLSHLCFEGPDDQLNDTSFAQAAIYVAGVACVRALEHAGILDARQLVAAAGLSLGEYTALHLAGAFAFDDGLRLVWKRGRFMQDAALASRGGMVALVGADESQAGLVCDAARGSEVLVPANFNCPGQIVISGSADACRRALSEAEKLGLRATALTVAGAFHSPLMAPAADRMAEALHHAVFAPPRVPVLSNVTGQPHSPDPARIKQLLVDQITQPVRWEQDVRWLLANVKGRPVEPAPGKVLSGLMRRIDKSVKVDNHAEPA